MGIDYVLHRDCAAKQRLGVERLVELCKSRARADALLAISRERGDLSIAGPFEQVVDFAIQIHGGMGVSHDTPLTAFFNQARSLRLADGPDEVHKGMIARLELMKYGSK